jgi:aryl-alcohol dehydrogenase-like predicted oxidoreductase
MDLAAIAAEHDRSAVELAVRFCMDRRAVDTVILGATRVEQLEQTLEVVDSQPLTKTEIAKCEAVWQGLSGPAAWYMR